MRKVFSYMRPYWRQIVIIFLLVGVTTMTLLLLPDYMSKIIGQGIYAEYLEMNPVTGEFEAVDFCSVADNPATCIKEQKSDFDVIFRYGGLMLGVTFLASIAAIALMYLSSHVSSRVGHDIRRDFFRKVSRFSVAETDRFGSSTLITRATNDVMQIQNFVMMFLRMMLRIPIIFVGALILSITKSRQLSQVLFGGIPALLIVIVIAFIFAVPLFKQVQKRIDDLTLVTREGINGVRVIRAFGQGKREVRRFEKENDRLSGTLLKAGRIVAGLTPVVNLLFNFVVAGIIYFAFLMVQNESGVNYQDLGNVSAVIQYSTQVMFSLLMLTMTFMVYPRAEVSGKRLKEILDTESKIIDTADDVYKEHGFKGEVHYDGVTFRYDGADANVLEDITFTATPGQTVALIGSTGSGKSTVAHLLPRFFDATGGTISIDDVPIKDIPLKTLRALIGFVPQKAFLFSGTIRENVAYGKENATEEEIVEALKVAQAWEFVNEMENGIDHHVDQGGVNLSGGQKQRISIARALVRASNIYVFDDSFSALDFETDAKLRRELRPHTKDATVFIVAQRIGTIMDADTILVMQEGKIVGKGKHKDLLKTCEVYKEIALSQLSEEELA